MSLRVVTKMAMCASALIVGAVSAEEEATSWWHWGWCPHRPDPVGNFEIERYMGKWY